MAVKRKRKAAARTAGPGRKAPLAKYQSMRNFSITAEPSGKEKVPPSRRLRFVI